MPAISGEWYEALKGEFGKPYYKKLFETVKQEYQTQCIFPPAEDVFNAFMENGVEFTSENIDKILTKENIKLIEDECILRVQEVLQQLVNDVF